MLAILKRRAAASLLAVAAAGACAMTSMPKASASAVEGTPVDFTLESSGGGTRSLSGYRGRVVVVFYEDRHHTDTNARTKEAVARYGADHRLQDDVMVVAVANLKGYDFAPASTIARKAIRAIAARFHIEILMDWRGVLIDTLGMKDATANVAVVDRNGNLRWRGTGRLNDDDQKALLAAVQGSLPPPAR